MTNAERLGYRAGVGMSCHQLGFVAHVRRDLDAAEHCYQRGLTDAERRGDQAGMGDGYHQLAVVAQDRGDPDTAEQHLERARAIREQLGDLSRLAETYGQLGLLALQRGDSVAALDWTIRCIMLFPSFPHPATGPAAWNLAMLTDDLGWNALHSAWQRMTGQATPEAVVDTIRAIHNRDDWPAAKRAGRGSSPAGPAAMQPAPRSVPRLVASKELITVVAVRPIDPLGGCSSRMRWVSNCPGSLAAPPNGSVGRTRLGIAHHLGWAVAVTASADHLVLDRRRIELVEPDTATAPIEHDCRFLSDAAAAALVAKERASVFRAASASLDQLTAALSEPIVSMSLRSWPLDFPDDIAVQRRPPYESRADSVLYLQVLAELARANGWAVHLHDASAVQRQTVNVLGERANEVLDGPRATLGPPWTKDHRMALAATIIAG